MKFLQKLGKMKIKNSQSKKLFRRKINSSKVRKEYCSSSHSIFASALKTTGPIDGVPSVYSFTCYLSQSEMIHSTSTTNCWFWREGVLNWELQFRVQSKQVSEFSCTVICFQEAYSSNGRYNGIDFRRTSECHQYPRQESKLAQHKHEASA